VNTFFGHLFGRKTKPLATPSNITTVPLTDKQIENAIRAQVHIEPTQLIASCAQSIGKQREHNEDCLFNLSITIGSDGKNIPLGLFIVADGMGGYQYGEIASSAAARTMAGYFIKKFQPYLVNPANIPDEPIQDLMRNAINESQRAVTQMAPGSGTTLTAALVLGQQMTIGHVGDSRAYAIHKDGRADLLTRDHSLVKRLIELGQISSEEALAHPQRNVLYRAIGQGDFLEPDIFTAPFPQPGYLLLCSDGLWSVVPDDRLVEIVNKSPTIQDACQHLVDAANDAGGPDNISVALVQMFG
jgi:serine/threonine protein phosphatase PrpC